MKSSQQRAREAATQYGDEGYAIIENAVGPDLVHEGQQHIDWLLEQNPDLRPEALGTGEIPVVEDPFWVRLVSDDRLLDIVEEFIGPDIALFASAYVAKRPGDGTPVEWHQDGAYWPLEPKEDVVTIWLAFDQTRPSNGAMQVIPGTQTMALAELEDTDGEDLLSSRSAVDVDEDDAVTIELEPGDASVHHPNVLHGSSMNESYTWRRGLTIRYIPTSTRILPDAVASPLLLRGDPDDDTNTYHPWPLHDPAQHMPFEGSEAYNERARLLNDRLREHGVLRGGTSVPE